NRPPSTPTRSAGCQQKPPRRGPSGTGTWSRPWTPTTATFTCRLPGRPCTATTPRWAPPGTTTFCPGNPPQGPLLPERSPMLDVLEYPAQGSAVNPTTGPGPVYNRRTVLGQLANGERPEQVFGPDREKAARELARYLSGIRLDREERL